MCDKNVFDSMCATAYISPLWAAALTRSPRAAAHAKAVEPFNLLWLEMDMFEIEGLVEVAQPLSGPVRIAATKLQTREARKRPGRRCSEAYPDAGTIGLADGIPRHAASCRLGPDDGKGIKDARAATIEPNEQRAIGPTQIQLTWRTLSKHVQLMAQYQDFGF